jgi:putative two-component system response regulator
VNYTEQRVPRALVVDDNPEVREVLCHALRAEGYEVDSASDGLEALQLVHLLMPDLVLLDIDMPGLNGDEVCRQIKQGPTTRLIPVVMITGNDRDNGKLAAWDYGADEFLTKPFRVIEVIARCRSLLRIKRLVEERDSAETVLFALARTVEAKSAFTHGHSERVTNLSLRLARRCGIGPDGLELLRKGALLHDIGKIAIPDDILNKPGKLTAEEYDTIKKHPTQGAHILEPLASLRDVLPMVRWHHERFDGAGYPDRLAGTDIPLLVRVLSVCDVFDSLSSDRPYRNALPLSRCLEIHRDMAATGAFDPEVAEEFYGMMALAAPQEVASSQ